LFQSFLATAFLASTLFVQGCVAGNLESIKTTANAASALGALPPQQARKVPTTNPPSRRTLVAVGAGLTLGGLAAVLTYQGVSGKQPGDGMSQMTGALLGGAVGLPVGSGTGFLAYKWQGNPDKLANIKSLEQRLEIGGSAQEFEDLGDLEVKAGRMDEATKAYEKALRLDGNYQRLQDKLELTGSRRKNN
jgi:hypothetical protein